MFTHLGSAQHSLTLWVQSHTKHRGPQKWDTGAIPNLFLLKGVPMPCGTLPHTHFSQTPQKIPHLWHHPSQCFCCFNPHQRDTNLPRVLGWIFVVLVFLLHTGRNKEQYLIWSNTVLVFFIKKTARQQLHSGSHCKSSWEFTSALWNTSHLKTNHDNPVQTLRGIVPRDYLCHYTD